MTNNFRAMLEAELDQMVKDRFPEGLVRTLERKFPGGRDVDIEDAVADGFEKPVKAGRAMENPRGYITTVAVNSMRRTLRRSALEQLPEEDDDHAGAFVLGGDPTAEEAISEVVYDFVRPIVHGWESTKRPHRDVAGARVDARR